MGKFKTKTTIAHDRSLRVTELPFQAGDEVEVIIESLDSPTVETNRYPLRGEVCTYEGPFDGVAIDEWDISE